MKFDYSVVYLISTPFNIILKIKSKRRHTILFFHPLPFKYLVHLSALHSEALVRRFASVEVKSTVGDGPYIWQEARCAKCVEGIDSASYIKGRHMKNKESAAQRKEKNERSILDLPLQVSCTVQDLQQTSFASIVREL